MARIYLFADEGGNFDFSHKRGASRYFLLTTVRLLDCSIGDRLLELRRQLAWEGIEISDAFHAAEEEQRIRDRVFQVLATTDFRVDATLLEKPKARPHLTTDEHWFYQTAWYLHFKYLAPQLLWRGDELLVTAASIKTKKKRLDLRKAVRDVIEQVASTSRVRVACWPAASDPCLQVADYCCWAIQRKWERGDNRSYDLIKDKVRSEFDVFKQSSTLYY